MRAMHQGFCDSDAQLESQRCDRVGEVTLGAQGRPGGRISSRVPVLRQNRGRARNQRLVPQKPVLRCHHGFSPQ